MRFSRYSDTAAAGERTLHESKSDFGNIQPEKMHEGKSEIQRELHETTSEFRNDRTEAVHESKSEIKKRLHEITSETVGKAAWLLLDSLRRAAAARKREVYECQGLFCVA